MTFAEFKKIVNDGRKTKKWYYFSEVVDGKVVFLKGYDTWLQIYDVDGVRYGNSMERSVKQFGADLLAPFKEKK
jgi:hypothetical protein